MGSFKCLLLVYRILDASRCFARVLQNISDFLDISLKLNCIFKGVLLEQ